MIFLITKEFSLRLSLCKSQGRYTRLIGTQLIYLMIIEVAVIMVRVSSFSLSLGGFGNIMCQGKMYYTILYIITTYISWELRYVGGQSNIHTIWDLLVNDNALRYEEEKRVEKKANYSMELMSGHASIYKRLRRNDECNRVTNAQRREKEICIRKKEMKGKLI
jgi:hypothetical protein